MIEPVRTIFSGMQMLLEQKWVSDRIVIVEENKIAAILSADMLQHHLPARHHQFDSDCYLIPGLIDLHIHGANGKDVMDGDMTALLTISKALAAEGVTSYLATTMTASNEHLEAVLLAIYEAMSQTDGAAILGAHLEGPFIAKNKMGAHFPDAIQVPDISVIKRWQRATNDVIKLVTLAPELSDALPFISELKNMKIITSIGHTEATYEETVAAIEAGCTQATHLFNAMTGIHQRKPGAVSALLLSDKISAELIVDGIHLHPAIVELALKVKGKDRLLLVTDAIRAKCMGDGRYELGGQEVHVQSGKATLADGTLAGSTLRMPEAVRNMVNYTKCSLAEAIHMASYTPAHVLGLLSRKGTISVGKDADMVVLDNNLNVLLTMREGKDVYP